MAEFRKVLGDETALKYEFITQMREGIWKVYRKSDRVEFLAHDITEKMIPLHDQPSELGQTASTELSELYGLDMVEPLMTVLNHRNLVSLRDVFVTDFADGGAAPRRRYFVVWDYCDAGTLANIFVPPTAHSDHHEDDEELPDVESEPLIFLPEGLCWHVLVSVLQALAWLHDGVRVFKEPTAPHDSTGPEAFEYADNPVGRQLDRLNELQYFPLDPDWQPILHRRIAPENIFLSHPRRSETYGPCRLGNYGDAFISGHCQNQMGMQGVSHAPKVLSPAPGHHQPLDEVIREDNKLGSLYPQQPGQPYTMLSEYRALGEIVQAMMVVPTSNDHESHLRTMRAKPVEQNIGDTAYSADLKNFVVRLMKDDPWTHAVPWIQTGPARRPPNDRPPYVTSKLMVTAHVRLRKFMEKSPEGEFFYPGFKATDDQDFDDFLDDETQLESLQEVRQVLATQELGNLADRPYGRHQAHREGYKSNWRGKRE
ncbi:hypothetical protein GGR56DRAFT_638293 [Xylariaceae sp. FL0804]|nr:hypothetical protein GGR56DRAFT_638293 [Xylariaceae sp. FL0804]